MPSSTPTLPVIKIESFEGPYDLLLELAREHKVDLTAISLRAVTDEFLAYIKQHRIPSLLQADFLVVAATLLLLKLKQTLPSLTDEEEEEITELTDRVRLYQLYREQAHNIRQRWSQQLLLPGPEKLPVQQTAPYPTITPDQLATRFATVIGKIKLPPDKRRHLRRHGRSLKQCIEIITERLSRLREVQFQDVVSAESRETVAVTFLAVLELCREQQVQLEQAQHFHPITIRRAS